MANELQAETDGQTGIATPYFILKNTAGLVWNGSGFAAYSTANRNAGAISATGRADGSYVADIPSVNAGAYYYSLWEQLGAGPAESDTLLAGGGEIEWGGSAVGVYPTSRVAGAVWDELASSHQTVDTLGYQLSQLYTGTVSASGIVADAAPAATSFKTNLTSAVTGFYDDMLLVFVSGALAGQARPIVTFTQTNGVFAFDEGFTSAPGNGDTFNVLISHVHPLTQIADAVLDRNIKGGSNGGRTVAEALASSRNKVVLNVDGTFDVYDTDDTTVLWSGVYQRGVNTLGPLTQVDPG